MTPYMKPTAEQIKAAQEAGNVAYSNAYLSGRPLTECYDAYRTAYEAVRDAQERAWLDAITAHSCGVDCGLSAAQIAEMEMRDDWNNIKGDCAL